MTRPTLTATKGLPGSGKSYWAREQQARDPSIVLVDKDSLRALLHGGKWSKGNEKQVVAIRDAIVIDALDRRRSVIVHDTNLAGDHLERLEAIAGYHDAAFRVQDFTDVPLGTCIERDATRPHPVGEKVIRRMWRDHLWIPPTPPAHDASLPTAILCDIDGTLAIMCDRSPYDTTMAVMGDTLNEPVARMLAYEADAGHKIILMSGRQDSVRHPTVRWLDDLGIVFDRLYMRPTGDQRKDSIVKRELYEEYVKGKFNVAYVIDDRPQVVRMWRDELGLFVFDVNQQERDF